MRPRLKVLVVDDEPAMREVLKLRLEQWGCEVFLAASGDEALGICSQAGPDLVLCDVVLPGATGLDLLVPLRGTPPARPVIMVTAHGTIDAAVEAVKQGAMDFLTKPLDYGKLQSSLEAAASEVEQRGSIRKLEKKLSKDSGLRGLIGETAPMREVYRLIEVIAGTDAAAFITGESGTGKELVARAIHDLGARSEGPFMAVNAAAIPEGLLESELFGHEKGAFTGALTSRPGCFEMADRGTLFLDEIAEMPAALQPKFLRTLEDGKVRRLGGREEKTFDVRVLAATNRDPAEALSQGALRKDLYYRLNVFTVTLPPLRDRRGDLPLLAQHFIAVFNAKHAARVVGLRPEVLAQVEDYPWPGNIRELRNVVERAVILAREGWVEIAHLPPYLKERQGRTRELMLPPGLTLAEAEHHLILATLEETGGNKAEAARRLGLDVKTIRNKLKVYDHGGEA